MTLVEERRERTPSVIDAPKIPKPPIKIAGGKGQMLDALRPHFPKTFGTYFEPFFGGGAVFFDLFRRGRVSSARLGDSNAELVRLFHVIGTDVDGLIEKLRSMRHTKKDFYVIREQDPSKLSDVARAARTLYLNKTCFNGLWRVNKQGKFNVSFGDYKNPLICDEENLRAVSAALQNFELECIDFEVTVDSAKKGDFVFFDPPYLPVSKTAKFVSYTQDGFTPDDHERLAVCAERLVKSGVHVIVMNADLPWVRTRYEKFKQVCIHSRRSINSNIEKRTGTADLILISK